MSSGRGKRRRRRRKKRRGRRRRRMKRRSDSEIEDKGNVIGVFFVCYTLLIPLWGIPVGVSGYTCSIGKNRATQS